MQAFRVFKDAAIVLATWGVIFPTTYLRAGEQKIPARPAVKITAANSVLDVTLSKEGLFTGRVLDHGGVAEIGVTVIVKQGTNIVGEAVTDKMGNFAVPNLKSGLYQVSSGATVGSYRVWNEKVAPPSAMPHVLLVLGQNGARGQYGLSQTIFGENLGLMLLCATTGLAAAALVVALHAENVADSANNSSHSP